LLGHRVDAETDLVPDVDEVHIRLVDGEVQLEGVGATDHEQQLPGIRVRADALLGAGSEDDAIDRRADDRGANLLIEEIDLAAQYIYAETLQALVGGVVTRRRHRRGTIRRRYRGGGCVAFGAELIVAQVRYWRAAPNERTLLYEHAVHYSCDHRPNLGPAQRAEHGIRSRHAERPANQ